MFNYKENVMEHVGGEKKKNRAKERQFKSPQDEDKISKLSFKNFAEQSKKKIRWAVNLYSEWQLNRMKQLFVDKAVRDVDLACVGEIEKANLCYALCRFITEIKKVDNSEYPPNTIREIIIMVQMHLQQNGVYWKLLDDVEFFKLRNIVDNTMKERHAQGLGVRKSCNIISMTDEDRMFQCKALGDENPQMLLRTVIYMMGLHLALRGGVEHTRLRRPGFNCQIKTDVDEETGKEILVYCEDPLQKTNQGGLVGSLSSKKVTVFPSSDPKKCPVRLFAKYCALLPQGKSCGKLYLRPRPKPTPAVWFCDQPYGKNKVTGTVKELAKMSGLDGKYSNHSLRATSASRMYVDKIPEQVIKEITGHKSDCVRLYKRTNRDILKEASNSIGGCKKDGSPTKKAKVENVTKTVKESDVEIKRKERLKESLSACQIIKNVVKTRMELRKKMRKAGIRKMATRYLKLRGKKFVETSTVVMTENALSLI